MTAALTVRSFSDHSHKVPIHGSPQNRHDEVLESNQATTVSFARDAVDEPSLCNHRLPCSHQSRMSYTRIPSFPLSICVSSVSSEILHVRSSYLHILETLIMHTPPRVHLANCPSSLPYIHYENGTTPSNPSAKQRHAELDVRGGEWSLVLSKLCRGSCWQSCCHKVVDLERELGVNHATHSSR